MSNIGSAQYVSGLVNAAGTVAGAYGTIKEGQGYQLAASQKEVSADFTAKQLENRAKQVEMYAGQQIAASQRAASEERRQSRLAQSRIIALAAASGGSVADESVVNLLSRTAGEGSYRAGLALYEGETQARALRDQASTLRGQAAADRQAAGIEAGLLRFRANTVYASGLADIAETGVSLYDKYGLGGPSTTTTTKSWSRYMRYGAPNA